MTRIIKSPIGNELTCKNWLIEAAYRMIQNNLDAEVAFDPENLIVYGGRGKAARNWESYDAILRSLKELNRGWLKEYGIGALAALVIVYFAGNVVPLLWRVTTWLLLCFVIAQLVHVAKK